MHTSLNGFWVLLLVVGLAFGAAALAVLLRAVRGGAFDETEDVKYVVFRDEDEDDEEPPPPPPGAGERRV